MAHWRCACLLFERRYAMWPDCYTRYRRTPRRSTLCTCCVVGHTKRMQDNVQGCAHIWPGHRLVEILAQGCTA
jgi:hypothetical protein